MYRLSPADRATGPWLLPRPRLFPKLKTVPCAFNFDDSAGGRPLALKATDKGLVTRQQSLSLVSGRVLVLGVVVASFAAGLAIVESVFTQPDGELALALTAVLLALALFLSQLTLHAVVLLRGCSGHTRNCSVAGRAGKVPEVTRARFRKFMPKSGPCSNGHRQNKIYMSFTPAKDGGLVLYLELAEDCASCPERTGHSREFPALPICPSVAPRRRPYGLRLKRASGAC
jgi:hypothetical protein